MKKRSGFTLAEVLITLTIIGVVAAITLPSINANTGAVRARTLLKKGLSTLNNAVMMNIARNEWSFADLEATPGDDEDRKAQRASRDRTMCGLLNETLIGETYQGTDSNGGEATNEQYKLPVNADGSGGLALNQDAIGSAGYHVTYQLADGIVIGLNFNATNCTENKKHNGANSASNFCRGFIDINGAKGPNRIITCLDGTAKYIQDENDDDYNSCEVADNPNADIFPIVFYDSTVELASNAAKAFFNAR